jgi:hypothetical protein|tara:strand:+ start:410 stop:760 length:351 start_codon:yes stop_codon:yes gene_type:complete
MASGHLAYAIPATATSTTIYIPATGVTATFAINCVNINTDAADVRIQVAATASISNLTDSQYVEHSTPLTVKGTIGNVLERTGLVVAYDANAPGGNGIVVRSSTGQVAFNIWGIEA